LDNAELRYVCPICGWPRLLDDAADRKETICICCGTQFGMALFDEDYPELRQRWFDKGMTFKHAERRPEGWDPIAQLRAAGLPTP
jgi:transcription initiation factor TFIIIB Brf1 subunit/transcription initiation factor TFIIB